MDKSKPTCGYEVRILGLSQLLLFVGVLASGGIASQNLVGHVLMVCQQSLRAQEVRPGCINCSIDALSDTKQNSGQGEYWGQGDLSAGNGSSSHSPTWQEFFTPCT